MRAALGRLAAIMTVRRGVAVLAVVAALAAGGCRRDPGPPPPAPSPTDDTAAVRKPVEEYLVAMRAKDVNKGREQLCEGMRATFDQNATGPDGDFASHFTVPRASVVTVAGAGDSREVTASVTVQAQGQATAISVLFTVSPFDGGWCIAAEKLTS